MFSKAYEAVRMFVAMRGPRLVECPETHEVAAVVLDAAHAARTTGRGKTEIRLRSCSRWPEKANCAQACVRQIETAPAECMLKHFLMKWYADKNCVICKESIKGVDCAHEKAALMRPDGTIAEWCEFRAEQIPSVLETHLPVCWDCYVEETFKTQHPELFD